MPERVVAAGSGVTFHPATGLDEPALGAVQAAVRRRLLRALERRGLLAPEDAQLMAAWEHGGGFSVNAAVRIERHDRNGLERLLRYCARPAFALERLREIDPEHLVYASVKPGPKDRAQGNATSEAAHAAVQPPSTISADPVTIAAAAPAGSASAVTAARSGDTVGKCGASTP